MTPAEQKAPGIDEKTEIIRKALEEKYGHCSVNRGPRTANFYYNGFVETVSKDIIEVLPLVDTWVLPKHLKNRNETF